MTASAEHSSSACVRGGPARGRRRGEVGARAQQQESSGIPLEQWAATLGTRNGSTRRAKKQLGQHWLTDPASLNAVADAANVQPGDRVLEIGAGTGLLSSVLLRRGASLIALERDSTLASELECSLLFPVSSASALRADLGAAADRFRCGHRSCKADAKCILDESDARRDGTRPISHDRSLPRVKIVANIPYYLTTDLLERLLPLGDAVSDVVVMIQREVAYRLAKPESVSPTNYRSMTVQCQLYSDTSMYRHVSSKCFQPPPEVESAIACFSLKRPDELPVSDVKRFLSFVKVRFPFVFSRIAFFHRRALNASRFFPRSYASAPSASSYRM